MRIIVVLVGVCCGLVGGRARADAEMTAKFRAEYPRAGGESISSDAY